MIVICVINNVIERLKDFHNGDGVCIYLDKKLMQCKIYETRPNVCRVETMYDLVYHKEFKTKEQFYSANMDICNILKEEHQKNRI